MAAARQRRAVLGGDRAACAVHLAGHHPRLRSNRYFTNIAKYA